MDPFSALSIAASAVQFFDFSLKVFKLTKSLRRNKSEDQNEWTELRQMTKDLAQLSLDLQHISEEGRPIGQALSRQEEALSRLAKECSGCVDEFLAVLNHTKVPAGTSKWRSFRVAVLIATKSGKIEELEARIEKYHHQLVSRLLACLDAKVDLYNTHTSGALEQLDHNDKRILEVVAFAQNKLSFELRKGHQEIVSALFTLNNGQLCSLTTQEKPQFRQEKSGLPNTNKVAQDMLAFKMGQPISVIGAGPLQRDVLDCLKFRCIRDRQDSAKTKHGRTLEWIYYDLKSAGEKPWSSFKDFLASARSQIYWIRGKPGSGKTTLMKFIMSDQRTQKEMQEWAGAGHLLFASFFFWNLGPDDLQKSQEGLLRSLLHDILERQPNLIPIVMPELCLDIMKVQKLQHATALIAEPNLTELIRWFRRLLDQTNETFRLCFLIDGIDEYTGRHGELCELILDSIKSCSWVKFVVSSRPVIPCIEAFSVFPSLRLQDINRDDIRTYASDLLSQKLSNIANSQTEVLDTINKLGDRSSGVFLWVFLAVRSLIEGLDNGDNMSELQERLEELPPDLFQLYQHMFNSVPKRYHQQASLYFRALLQALDYEAITNMPYLVSAFHMSFIEVDLTEARALRPQSTERIQRRCDDVERRIQSRCCGLLEVNQRMPTEVETWPSGVIDVTIPSQYGSTSSLLKRRRIEASERKRLPEFCYGHQGNQHGIACIEFIHRSVVEFLRDPLVFQSLSPEISSLGDLHLRQNLFLAYLSSLKVATPGFVFGMGSSWAELQFFQLAICNFTSDLMESKSYKTPFPVKHIKELFSTLETHWTGAELWADSIRNWSVLSPTKGHWVRSLLSTPVDLPWSSLVGINETLLERIDTVGDLFAVLLLAGPRQFGCQVDHQITQHDRQDLLTRLLNIWCHLMTQVMELRSLTGDQVTFKGHLDALIWNGLCGNSNVDMIQYLVSNGANPNFVWETDTNTSWTMFVKAMVLLELHKDGNKLNRAVRAALHVFTASHLDQSSLVAIEVLGVDVDSSLYEDMNPLIVPKRYGLCLQRLGYQMPKDDKGNIMEEREYMASEIISLMSQGQHLEQRTLAMLPDDHSLGVTTIIEPRVGTQDHDRPNPGKSNRSRLKRILRLTK